MPLRLPPTSPAPLTRLLRAGLACLLCAGAVPASQAEDWMPVSPVVPVEIPALPRLPTTIDLTRENEELWERIRQGFAMPDLSDELVLSHQQWYMAHPEYLRRMIERSRPYLHYIVSELERRNMPMELALLPMVESAYNPLAYSPAKAAGLWQFIPSTGKNYKLDQNWWEDERRDIVASTDAALDYLQAIYEMHGDWHLALASYNWGEGAVGRAIAKSQAKGLPSDFSSLTLPKETRHYVPKLQALKNIFSNPLTFAELNLPSIPNRPFFKRVNTPTPIDVKLAARLANMPLKEFLALNPSHNRPLIKDTSLLLPTDRVDTFEENLRHYDAPLQTWETYTLKPGERLDKLAPRFGLPLEELKRINGLSPKVHALPGQTLLVPGKYNTDTATSLQDWRMPVPPPKPAPAAHNAKAAGKAVKGTPSARAGNGKTSAKPAASPKGAAKPLARSSAKAPAPAKPAAKPAAKAAPRKPQK